VVLLATLAELVGLEILGRRQRHQRSIVFL
jgi:hypothetical protein